MLDVDNQDDKTFFWDVLAKWGTMHSSKAQKNWARVHELLHLYLPSVVFISTCLIRHPYQNPHSMWVFAGETACVLLQHPKFKILNLNQIYFLRNFQTHCVYIHSYASRKKKPHSPIFLMTETFRSLRDHLNNPYTKELYIYYLKIYLFMHTV